MTQDFVKQMAKVFESYRYAHGVYTAFEDFLELAAIEISNPVDLTQKEKRNERYVQIAKKYSQKEFESFGDLLGMLIMAMESEPDDYLGKLFMDLELYESWSGQFFTPLSVAKLMAQMAISEPVDHIKEKGSVTVYEPTVGGGVTVIALFTAIKDAGYNPLQTMRVTAQDIDKKAVHMAYIQLSLLGINATIIHGDTLHMETREVWYSPGYFFGWGYGDRSLTCKTESDAQVTDKLQDLVVEETMQLSFF